MNFLCPACRTPLPRGASLSVVGCTQCGVQVDLTRLDTAPGTARLWPDVDLEDEKLGEYTLGKRIAAGGMGVVYEANGPAGPCAVKVLAALLAADPGLRERFRREAAALRAIVHPGVVRMLGEGEERGFCWYAMERIDGEDLRARIVRGRLPAPEVEALARSLLDALATVHERGFIHRDVKPGNILLAKAGPKLCDFGIARCDGSSTLTESAAVLGSLRYMAPEQRLGRTTARSDLYSLGVVLHEALSGNVPGETELPAGTPAKLRRLVGRLLASKADERPADARAALALLDAKPRTRLLAAAAALCVLAVGGTGVVVGLGERPRVKELQRAELKESPKDPTNQVPIDPKMAAAPGSPTGAQQLDQPLSNNANLLGGANNAEVEAPRPVALGEAGSRQPQVDVIRGKARQAKDDNNDAKVDKPPSPKVKAVKRKGKVPPPDLEAQAGSTATSPAKPVNDVTDLAMTLKKEPQPDFEAQAPADVKKPVEPAAENLPTKKPLPTKPTRQVKGEPTVDQQADDTSPVSKKKKVKGELSDEERAQLAYQEAMMISKKDPRFARSRFEEVLKLSPEGELHQKALAHLKRIAELEAKPSIRGTGTKANAPAQAQPEKPSGQAAEPELKQPSQLAPKPAPEQSEPKPEPVQKYQVKGKPAFNSTLGGSSAVPSIPTTAD